MWNRVPVKVRRLLQACLEKDPKRRLRDIGDVWRLLEDPPGPAAVQKPRQVGSLGRCCRAGRFGDFRMDKKLHSLRRSRRAE